MAERGTTSSAAANSTSRPRAFVAGRERIVGVQVTFEDGRVQEWSGRGSVALEHTSTHHQIHRPYDVHYVEAVLKFDPPPETLFPETGGVNPYAMPERKP